jgi:hypothetical protein
MESSARSLFFAGAPLRSALKLAGFALAAWTALAAPPAVPDFGSNVVAFRASTSAAEIQAKIDAVYAAQRKEFGSGRSALLFAPGDYKVDIPVGFYTQVLGLGASPDEVRISGNLHSDASLPNNNATCTFWKTVEGLAVTPTVGTMQWAVSQAAPFRRMHVASRVGQRRMDVRRSD